jgi:hypothetical protein
MRSTQRGRIVLRMRSSTGRRPAACTARRLTPLQTVVSGNIVVEDSADVDPGEDPPSAT